jgi:single-strand DNA-binding protein
MFNEAHISLSGYVATQPALRETRSGIPSVTMRVAWTPRRLDRSTGEWVDAGTSFATVQLYRKLAENAATCLRKGDPVVVRGRVTVREFEARNGQQRTVVEIDAHSVGHDLTHGIATFHRVRPQTGLTAAEFRAADDEGLSGPVSGSADADADDDAGLTGEDQEPGEPDTAAGYPGDDASTFPLAGTGTEPGPEEPSAGPDAIQQETGDGSKARRRRGAQEKALAAV